MASIRQPARERLLRAADALFYANGIAATGVDAVIAKAGVATGSLYKNFSGKDDLVAAYLAERDQRFRGMWDAHVEAETDPVGRLLAIFGATEQWALEADLRRGCAHVAAAAQLPDGHAGIGVAAGHKRHVIDRLTALAGAAGLRDPGRAASDIALIYDGMLSGLAIGVDAAPIERGRRLAEAVIEHDLR
ncbi:TetR/AcrR family transcriptional regulator [Mycolicibacterium pyrenivorans]|uniref:TetR/AcrR family transcriptional regulator n=1 Tax=Mycolicibacterium pyrenivorans TaxID=187102 RepID=UPI0021F26D89|nr:TetR/AcrR family transcriptional regulator [Mycolicibacterium pyrenivorans]MCV7154938.1 TetR/AcrR family transcriptional regulator [Mycolicibacterium pyrenivorans]